MSPSPIEPASVPDEPLLLAIYATVTSDAASTTLLGLLARRFECASAALFYVDQRCKAASITVAHGILADGHVQALYRDYAALDPAPGAMAHLALGEVASTDDLFRGAQLIEHARFLEGFYYAVGLGGALGGPLANGDGRIGLVAVQRARDRAQFTVDERAAFGALMPHMIQAIELRRTFFEVESLAAQAEAGLDAIAVGVLAFRPDGIVHHANQAARAVLARKDGLALTPEGRLRVSDPGADRRLRALLASRDASGSLIVRDPLEGRPRYLLRFARPGGRGSAEPALGPVVIVSDPDRPVGDPVPVLRAAFHLSAKGAQLVAALMAGEDLRAFADRSGISVNTAKYHLKMAFQLTGVRRQAELVRLGLCLTREVG